MSMAQVKSSPAATDRARNRPATACGTAIIDAVTPLVPFPASPSMFRPQHHTLSSSAMAHACRRPTARVRAGRGIRTSTGRSAGAGKPGATSLRPQQYAAPLRARPQVNPSPARTSSNVTVVATRTGVRRTERAPSPSAPFRPSPQQ
jgi:hypothetical protein